MENNFNKSISYFCPAFNEEENLTKVVESAFAVLKETGSDFEIIIIDNASVDNTLIFPRKSGHKEELVVA